MGLDRSLANVQTVISTTIGHALDVFYAKNPIFLNSFRRQRESNLCARLENFPDFSHPTVKGIVARLHDIDIEEVADDRKFFH